MDETISGGKLVSLKKAEANRRNAKHSTGPRTAEGKQRSRRNALKHGIFASALLVDDAEDAEQFHKLLCEVRADYEPVGSVEELLVERLAVCWWRLQRALRFEANAIARSLNGSQGSSESEPPATPQEVLQIKRTAVEEAETMAASATDEDSSIRKQVHWTKYPEEMAQQQFTDRLQQLRSKRETDEWMERTLLAKAREMGFANAAPALVAEAWRGLQATVLGPAKSLPLPSEKDLVLILRYENSLRRDLAFAMNQLERMQRTRRGEHVPPPVTVNLAGDQ